MPAKTDDNFGLPLTFPDDRVEPIGVMELARVVAQRDALRRTLAKWLHFAENNRATFTGTTGQPAWLVQETRAALATCEE